MSTPTKTNAVQPVDWNKPTDKRGLESLAPMVGDAIKKALPSFMAGQAERLVRCLITECQTTPALFECTPLSLFGCCIKAAQLGLEIGGPLGRAYLIPFGNSKKGVKEAQLIPGYRGLIELIHRSGQVKRITPVVVRDGDRFEVCRGLNQDLIHVPLRGNTNAATDYYVVVQLVNGGNDFETMTFEEALHFRDRYSTMRTATDWLKAKSPWYEVDSQSGRPGEGFNAMALKTLIRKISKRVPMSSELAMAVDLEDRADRSESQQIHLGTMPDLLGGAAIEDKADKLQEELNSTRVVTAEVKAADAIPALIAEFDTLNGDWLEFLGTNDYADTDAILKLEGAARKKAAMKLQAAIDTLKNQKGAK